MTHQQKTSQIRQEIIKSYQDIRKKYPILKQQNFMGFSIFVISLMMICLASYFWWLSILPTWFLIIFNAFWLGVMHELEHDLIHFMYFKKKRFVQNIMLFTIWILRPLTINPWVRRTLHFHHHKFSGETHDVEERAVTNGEKWGIKRLLTTPDIVLAGLFRLHKMFIALEAGASQGEIKDNVAQKLKKYLLIGVFPLTILAHLILYVFTVQLVFEGTNALFDWQLVMPGFIDTIMKWCYPLVAILLLPNLLRQFSLHFITSNLHYYGDVEKGNVLQQTQVLNVWWTFPMQIFCFFFGWTHAIHHFVVNETFYIRHIARKKAYKAMKQYGVRFNDLGTFKRANRYN